jgi:hypothetical protein
MITSTKQGVLTSTDFSCYDSKHEKGKKIVINGTIRLLSIVLLSFHMKEK